MIVIPYRTSNTHYSMMVVLEDDNIARLKQYDPGEVCIEKFPPECNGLVLNTMTIAYIKPEDTKKLVDFLSDHKVKEAFQLLSSGWKFKPEQGDNDSGYQAPDKN